MQLHRFIFFGYTPVISYYLQQAPVSIQYMAELVSLSRNHHRLPLLTEIYGKGRPKAVICKVAYGPIALIPVGVV